MNDPTNTTGSLEASDAAAAGVQKTPYRVTLERLQGLVIAEAYFHPPAAAHVTICALTVRNGFTVTGISAPADPENFDAALGRNFARADAVRALWPLEGYLLAERLLEMQTVPAQDTEAAITDESGVAAAADVVGRDLGPEFGRTTAGAIRDSVELPGHARLAAVQEENAPGQQAPVGHAAQDVTERFHEKQSAQPQPSIGRIVHVEAPGIAEFAPAIVTGVHPGGAIDATVFLRHSHPQLLRLLRHEADATSSEEWRWLWPARA